MSNLPDQYPIPKSVAEFGQLYGNKFNLPLDSASSFIEYLKRGYTPQQAAQLTKNEERQAGHTGNANKNGDDDDNNDEEILDELSLLDEKLLLDENPFLSNKPAKPAKSAKSAKAKRSSSIPSSDDNLKKSSFSEILDKRIENLTDKEIFRILNKIKKISETTKKSTANSDILNLNNFSALKQIIKQNNGNIERTENELNNYITPYLRELERRGVTYNEPGNDILDEDFTDWDNLEMTESGWEKKNKDDDDELPPDVNKTQEGKGRTKFTPGYGYSTNSEFHRNLY